MKVLIINKDESVFDFKSASFKRHLEYGQLVEELHIVVFSRRKSEIRNQKSETIFKNQKTGNIFLYKTNSRNKLFAIFDAFKISKKIIRNQKSRINDNGFLITAQDVFETGLVGWLLTRKFNLPLQLQIHTDFLSPYFWRESLLNKVRVLLAKFLIPRASCLRVVSERIKESLSVKVTVLPIFVDIEKIKNTPIKTDLHKKYPQFDFIILMASRLTKEKNISLAIEAMAEIVKKFPKAGLIIVGAGPEEKKLKAVSCELKANIIFESWTDDLVSYYKTADLFLLTSNYEGYGMTAVEALAAGCPVIMTDVGCAGEVIKNGESGIVISVGDKDKLTEAILNQNRPRGSAIGVKTKEQYLAEYKKSWESCIIDLCLTR